MEFHPLAMKSILTSDIPTSERLQQLHIGSCFLQIVGDIVGMFYWLAGNRLRVWNWQTGAMLAVCGYSFVASIHAELTLVSG
jgi:hypothetical protein